MARGFEDSTKLLNEWIRNNPVYPTNGYSTTPPQYNSYSVQFNPYRRVDYTKPIQTSQTPPINQALNENFQPQYVQTTDYNGQPVRVPTNAFSQFGDVVTQGLSDALDWAKQQAVQKAMMIGAGGLALGAPIFSTRLAMSTNPTVQRAVTTLAGTRLGRPIVDTAINFANNPYVQKVDKFIGRIGDLFY